MISIETTLVNHPNLTTTAFCVYYAIYEKIKNRGQKSTIYRIKDIASLCGISPKVVQRSVTQLRDEGLILIEKQGRDNLYSLPEEPQKAKKNNGQNRPVKPEKQTKTTVDSDRSINKHSNSNKSFKDINNIYYQISDIDSDNPVYREYKRMCNWHGQNFRRGRTEISPDDLAQRMAAITPETLQTISAVYERNRANIEYPTAYIQAAILHPWDTLSDPRASLACSGSAPRHEKKPSDKIHFELERSYDFDKLEKDLLKKQHKKYIQSQNAVMVVESDRKEQSNETIKRTN